MPTTPTPLAHDLLRWRCPAASLPFSTTADVEPVPGIVGQDAAVDALRFGLATNAPGHHVYVRGLAGTGRITLVQSLMGRVTPSCPEAKDRCFVRNFEQPDRPALISLPRGRAPEFRQLVDELADYIRDDLKAALDSDVFAGERRRLENGVNQRLRASSEPFEVELRAAGLGLVGIGSGPSARTHLAAIVDGEPVPSEALEQLEAAEKLTAEQVADFRANLERFGARMQELTAEVEKLRASYEEQIRAMLTRHVRSILEPIAARITSKFDDADVRRFVAGIVVDVVRRGVGDLAADEDFTALYRVNVVVHHDAAEGCPVVTEITPSLPNLLGSIDLEMTPAGQVRSDHTRIRAGALLRADGGFLLLEARDVLAEPGAWKVLVRTLRTGQLEIVPPELNGPWMAPSLKPQPVDLNVKVILVGDAETYFLLDQMDPDFPHLFKVLSDFDSTIERSDASAILYAGVLSRVVREEGLPHFDCAAVGALVEHGARVASKGGRLTTRFARIGDIAREAAFVAGETGDLVVGTAHVDEAIARTKRRADLPARRYRQLIAEGTIHVMVTGSVIGQINGLAVMHAGPLTYGFPQRITATVAPGGGGVINIEREAQLSGAIHTKGFYILAGLMRSLLSADHPLTFDASIAFEQSYGGIDGDSASTAETVCLFSALTGLPVRQDLAMTGAIDQTGRVMAIGGVNEKIEGFFDACADQGLTGTQGVVIPRSNVADLMLRADVVEACAAGQFAVYAVSTVEEALELFLGRAAGRTPPGTDPPAGSILAIALERAHMFWRAARRVVPVAPGAGAEDTEEALAKAKPKG